MSVDEQRFIVLADLDAFYASVEMQEDPTLVGKPLLIGGSPTGRGVVAAASYEARKFGCHSAMPMVRALRLCPEAVILHPRFPLYRNYSKQVMDVLRRESPLVEQTSIDEAYVELTPVVESMGEAEGLAHRMQGRIRVDVGLPCSIGLAPNKMVAKVACETGKPQGFVLVGSGQEAEFLSKLEVRMLPGIGPKSSQRLNAAGFKTLGQVAEAPLTTLMLVLGSWGAVVQRRARGEDPSQVHTERTTKSVSAEETFAEDVTEAAALREEITRMSLRIVQSLDKHGLLARTITLKLRDSNFHTITRSASRERATSDIEAIVEEAMRLLQENWLESIPLRLIGVAVSNLRPVSDPGQLRMNL